MSIIERLKQFIEHTGMSNSQFADFAGIPRPTLSQLVHGRNKTISDQLLRKLDEKFPQLDIRWLLCGKGTMLLTPDIEISEPQNGFFLDENDAYHPDISDDARSVSASEYAPQENQNRKNALSSASADEKNLRQGGDYSPVTDFSSMMAAEMEETPPYGSPSTPSDVFSRYGGRGMADTVEHAGHSAVDPTPSPEQSGAGREIESIIVFYSDKSFATFYPSGKN